MNHINKKNNINPTNSQADPSINQLWEHLVILDQGIKLNCMMMGGILHTLQEKYSSHRNGSFQKNYKEKGYKKNQVETNIFKYLICKKLEQDEDFIGGDATNKNNMMIIAEKSSQKTISALKKLSSEIQKKFLKGELSAHEVREMAEELKKNKVKKAKPVLSFSNSINKLSDKPLKLKAIDLPAALKEVETSEQILSMKKKEILEQMEKEGIEVPQ